MSSPAFILVFVSVFHLLGGLALGWGLRRVFARQFGSDVLYFFVWGAMFGFIPLFIGVAALAASGAGYLILVELLVLFVAIAFMAFTPDEYLAAFTSPQIVLTGTGGILVVLGAALFSATLSEDWTTALIAGGIFMLVGGLFFAIGVRMALKNR